MFVKNMKNNGICIELNFCHNLKTPIDEIKEVAIFSGTVKKQFEFLSGDQEDLVWSGCFIMAINIRNGPVSCTLTGKGLSDWRL